MDTHFSRFSVSSSLVVSSVIAVSIIPSNVAYAMTDDEIEAHIVRCVEEAKEKNRDCVLIEFPTEDDLVAAFWVAERSGFSAPCLIVVTHVESKTKQFLMSIKL